MTDEIEASFVFEAKKIGIVQNKDGYLLKLVIHPNDIPDELLRSWVGARYKVGMVEMDDQEQPVINPATIKRDRLIVSASKLCREPKFWRYLGDVTGWGPPVDEVTCRNMLCAYLDIESRSELATNKQARNTWDGIVGEFEAQYGK